MYTCPAGKLTIGVGFNLEANYLCDRAISVQLDADIEKATQGAKKAYGDGWDQLDEVRQEVLIQMVFQMGAAGTASFKNTLALIRAGDYAEAAAQMLRSRWARQTPQRARRLAKVMREGSYD